MKFLKLLIFLAFLTLPLLSYAYPGQYSWDPLHVEIVETPSQIYERQTKELLQQFDRDMQQIQGSVNSQQKIEESQNNYERWLKLREKNITNQNTINQPQQAGTLCNGKYWSACPTGQTFYCPSVGDAQCILANPDSFNQVCKKEYGIYSYYSGNLNIKNKPICVCLSGYIWQGDTCVVNEDKKSICPVGVFIWKTFPKAKTTADVLTEPPAAKQGPVKSTDCECPTNYELQDNYCVVRDTKGNSAVAVVGLSADSNTKALVKTDKALANKLRGRILLQVENHGEAWYVNPKTDQRYYMENGNEAYNIMRNLGVGITNRDLDKIKSSKSLAKKYSGKIFLQVEEHGEAYYIDFDGNAHYLKDGNTAYDIMRDLGLGITNNDLNKIIEE
jgi:hypothetical protein